MRSAESKGKTVDEAIFNGLTELGLSLDEVEIEIVHEGSKGLFGIGKSAEVRLTERDPSAPRPPEMEEAERPARRSRDDRRQGARPPRQRDDRPSDRPYDRPREGRPARTVVSSGQAGVSDADKFLNELFSKMKIGAVCKTEAQDDKSVSLVIEGQDTAVLIGRRGDTLDALQYLTGLVINRGRDDYRKVMLDAEDYRRKREATLEKLARRLAGSVAKYGKPVTLEPMNPYERRILHATLQGNPRVETHSEGEEPYRRVVIRRKRHENA